ncbi:DUF397 domain-containing protein [Streptomyces lutosisoli]|uniref:DUF397 domain-containing protein n=1 Tax=Streptomyces lutosisoli TaxID=2665721 RepID=A0ABW2VX84_9ACTN
MNDDAWRKSSRSTSGANCIEVKYAFDYILVRDSKITRRPNLLFSRASWELFCRSVRIGAL